MNSKLSIALDDIQRLLRDDEQEEGVVRPQNVMTALKLNQSIKNAITSIPKCSEVKDEPLSEVFAQLQLTCAYLMAMSDLRIKCQLPDLIERCTNYLLTSNPFRDVWETVVYPIAITSLEYIVSHLSRKVMTRVTALGAASEIDMDDTTGWEDLELHIKIYQSLLRGSLSVSVVFLSLWSLSVPKLSERENTNDHHEQENLHAWQILLKSCATHVNRHVRENFYTFMASLFQQTNFDESYLQISLSSSNSIWIDEVLQQLPFGLEDDWTQIRYAALLVLQEIARFLFNLSDSSIDNRFSFTSLMTKYADELLPRLCVNRFHAAPSVQSCAKHIWQTYFFHVLPEAAAINTNIHNYFYTGFPLGKQLLIDHIQAVIDYYVLTMTTARNHMVCEAAIHAFSEIMLRLPAASVSMFQDIAHTALLACLDDDRWPVKDAACLASGRVLRRFPPLNHHVNRTSVHTVMAARFLHHWEEHLIDCIWSVRENAAFACAEALVTDYYSVDNPSDNDNVARKTAIEEWKNMVWTLVEKVLSTNLLAALSDVDETIEVRTSLSNEKTSSADTIIRKQILLQSKIDSFLPREMVLAAQRKKLEQVGNNNDADENSNGNNKNNNRVTDSNDYRRGWGCCVDCVNLREPFRWEVTQGTLFLLREVYLLPQRARESASCDIFPESYLCEQETQAMMRRNAFLSQSWAFQVSPPSIEEDKDGRATNNYLLGMFGITELLRVTAMPSKSAQSDNNSDVIVKHPVKHLEKLHPAIYEEIPDIVQSISLWSQLLGRTQNNTASLSMSLLEAFWKELQSLLIRDMSLTADSEPIAITATRQARSNIALRVIAAEKCLTRLFTSFADIYRPQGPSVLNRVDNNNTIQNSDKEDILAQFASVCFSISMVDPVNNPSIEALKQRFLEILLPEKYPSKASSSTQKQSVRRIPATSSQTTVNMGNQEHSMTENNIGGFSSLITTDVMPNMLSQLSQPTIARMTNVIASMTLTDDHYNPTNNIHNTNNTNSTDFTSVPAPQLFYHGTSK